MAHRTLRLSISPEDLPDVRRVIDFDGRATLADVHAQIAAAYGLDREQLHAFFTSGRFWDKQSAFLDPRAEGRGTDRALLFRLNLAVGKTLAYLLNFAQEQHFLVTVLAITDVPQPLPRPELIESLGDAPEPTALVQATRETADSAEASGAEADPPELAELVRLAEAFLDAAEQLDVLDDEPETSPAQTAPLRRASGEAALALLTAIGGDTKLFFRLDDWLLQRSLSVRLLDLPLQLANASEHELAISAARALVFVDRELMQGDLAIVLAKAGRREEALAQLALNLEKAEDAALVEAKAGETHRALGDFPAAEAYFRRSLAEAKTNTDKLQALIRIASSLIDQGRDAEASELLKQAQQLEAQQQKPAKTAEVGRNDPCPCGSGKKYKKCHG
jgi:tetratricopeptide (TPR) repeat protein